MKKKIAVLYGGRGQEHAVSLASARAILSWLDRDKFDPLPVMITQEGDFFLCRGACVPLPDVVRPDCRMTPTFPVRLAGVSGFLDGQHILPVDAVLPCLHGDYGEDGRIQGLLDCAKIPYPGAGCTAGAVAADKALTKAAAKSLGIPTLPWLLFSGKESEDEALAAVTETFGDGTSFPTLFLKPNALGSSVGASPVRKKEDFSSAYRAAARYGRVLVEPLLSRPRELEVAALLTGEAPVLSSPGEILSGGDFYSYDEKYRTGTARISLSPTLGEETEARLFADSLALLSLLGCEGAARVDYFLTDDGSLYFNEINTFPGFTEISLYPRLMERAGIPPKELLTKLTEAALDRRV